MASTHKVNFRMISPSLLTAQKGNRLSDRRAAGCSRPFSQAIWFKKQYRRALTRRVLQNRSMIGCKTIGPLPGQRRAMVCLAL